jgi:prophage tail gpP-like protein
MYDDVTITVGGVDYAGWKTASVELGIDRISGKFSMSVMDQWAEGAVPWPIREGSSCEVRVNGTVVINGTVDLRETSHDGSSHSISVEGRDATAKLVRSSANVGWSHRKTTAKKMLEILCAQYEIPVSIDDGIDMSAVIDVAIGQGETSFAVIDRLCKFVGASPVADRAGGLRIISPGQTTAPVSLVLGGNILSASATFSAADRCGLYRVLGQGGGNKTSIVGEARDSGADAAIVCVIQAEDAIDQARATARAVWEANTRAARADTYECTVQGWGADGYIWTPGDIVSVDDPLAGIVGDMLLSGVTFSRQNSTTSVLSLVRPEAFAPEPPAEREWKT